MSGRSSLLILGFAILALFITLNFVKQRDRLITAHYRNLVISEANTWKLEREEEWLKGDLNLGVYEDDNKYLTLELVEEKKEVLTGYLNFLDYRNDNLNITRVSDAIGDLMVVKEFEIDNTNHVWKSSLGEKITLEDNILSIDPNDLDSWGISTSGIHWEMDSLEEYLLVSPRTYYVLLYSDNTYYCCRIIMRESNINNDYLCIEFEDRELEFTRIDDRWVVTGSEGVSFEFQTYTSITDMVWENTISSLNYVSDGNDFKIDRLPVRISYSIESVKSFSYQSTLTVRDFLGRVIASRSDVKEHLTERVY